MLGAEAWDAMPATSPPLISVILVCRNPGPRLAAALESVWAQTAGPTTEIVIVDGASTDGSVAWLETHRDRFTSFTSAPDQGVYDAMNKGVAAARGEWIFFLGADDRLASSGVFATAAETLTRTSAYIASGRARFDDGRLYSFADDHAAIRRNFVHHQATFYRRTLFANYGGFDLSLRIQADYEHNLRLLRAGERFAPLPLHVSECGSGGLSDSGLWANYREEIIARHRHYSAWKCWPWDLLSVARCLRKKIVRHSHRDHA